MHGGHDHSHSHSHSHTTEDDEHAVQGLSAWGNLIKPRPTLQRNLLISAAIVLVPVLVRRRVTRLDLGLFCIVSSLLALFGSAKVAFRSWLAKMSAISRAVMRHTTPLTRSYFFKNDNAADRVTLLGVAINIALSVLKFVGGIRFNSAVLVADAGHSLSDLLSDFICLWAVQVARLPADEDHPYGHGKFESIGSLLLSLTLLATGLSIGAWSYDKMIKVLHTQALFSHSAAAAAAASAASAAGGGVVRAIHAAATHSHALPLALPSWPALVLAAVSIASKEWLFQVTRKVGEALSSQIIIANAWHHRSDAFSSVLSFGSIGLAMTMPQLLAIDPAAGIFVAGMICITGVDVLIESVKELVDTNDSEAQKVSESVQLLAEGVEGVLGVKTVRVRSVGSGKNVVDMAIFTEGASSASASASIAEKTKWRIISSMPSVVVDVSVRTSPSDSSGMPFCPLLGTGQVSPAEVEASVRRAVLEAKSKSGGPQSSSPLAALRTVTRVTIHFLQTALKHADVFVRLDPRVSIADAGAVAESVRVAVLEAKAVDSLDVFLDLAATGPATAAPTGPVPSPAPRVNYGPSARVRKGSGAV